MKAEVYLPANCLQPFIKAYRIIESRHELVNRVLPNTSFTIAFRVSGQVSYITERGKEALPLVTFSGLRKSARLINYAPNSSTIIVEFKETGVPSFFKRPFELFEASISLDNFIPQSEITIVEERLNETLSNPEKIAVINDFFCSKLVLGKTDMLVAEAIRRIYSANGTMRISELANSLYISQDAFEKRFRKVTGTTPKQFSSIVKMKSVIAQRPTSESLLDMALENGYYDQPHFNKDFRLFTGLTPTDFFKSGKYW